MLPLRLGKKLSRTVFHYRQEYSPFYDEEQSTRTIIDNSRWRMHTENTTNSLRAGTLLAITNFNTINKQMNIILNK